MILSLLTLGKRQVKDLNLYPTPLIDPLIDDLQELWKHLDVIGATKLRGLQALKDHGIQARTIDDNLAHGFCPCLGVVIG